MPQTQVAMGRAFTYLDNLGRIGVSATTFWHPVGLGRGADDVMYVANWGHEFGPGTRITKCTISTQEFLLDIGSAGSGDGEFLWPGGLAVDDQENLYVTGPGHQQGCRLHQGRRIRRQVGQPRLRRRPVQQALRHRPRPRPKSDNRR